MKWTELSARVRKRAGTGAKETNNVLRALLDEMTEALCEGEEVLLPGLARFGSRWQEPRTLRAVRGRRKVTLDGRYVPRVRASGRLKKRMAERTPQLWQDPAHQAAWRLAETLVSDLELYHKEQLPAGITAETPPQDVDVACTEALGPAWVSARSTFAHRVPAEVRDHMPHLPMVARRRWAQR